MGAAALCLRGRAWQGAGLAILTVVVYLRSLSGGFLWDDEILTTKNPLFFDPNPWFRIFCSTDATDYYPLTWSLFFLEWRLFGNNPMAFHAVNLLLHVTGVILVWRVLERLRLPGAWFAALVFSIHPVNVATVAWVSQGKSTLALVFYACSVLCYLEYDAASEATTATSRRHALRWLGYSFACFLAALLSKASGLLLPLVLLSFTWWLRGSLDRARVLAVMPFVVLAVGMAFCTVWFQHHRAMEGDVGRLMDLQTRLVVPGWVFWFYVLHVLAPFRLMMVYPLEMSPGATNVLVVPWGQVTASSAVAWLPDVALVTGILVVTAARRRWGRPLLLALLYILAMLLPVMGLVEMSYMKFSLVSDHLLYMASIGFSALIVGCACRLPLGTGALRALGAGVAVTLAILAFRHQAAYLSAESLWRDTLAKNPSSWVAHFNLGSILEDQKRYSAAVQEYQEALRFSRPDAALWSNMGHALLYLGRAAEAVDCYRKALEIDENYADAHNNLGTALEWLGSPNEALWHYQRALAVRADFAEAHNNLGTLLAARGQWEAAAVHLRAALLSKPGGNPQAYASLARVLMNRGDLAQARMLAIRAIQDDARYVDGYRVLGLVLFRQRQYVEAAVVLEKARSLEPRNTEVLGHLGYIAAQQGKPREALAWQRAAAELAPNNPQFLNEQAWILATSADSGVRDGIAAVRLARRACGMADYRNTSYLDTLAAAQAEAGDFAGAVQSGQRAVALAEQAGDALMVRAVKARLDLYRSSHPYRE